MDFIQNAVHAYILHPVWYRSIVDDLVLQVYGTYTVYTEIKELFEKDVIKITTMQNS